MAYALTLLALLGVFLWATPAHTVIAEQLRRAGGITQSIASSSSDSLRAQAATVIESLRRKSMELLRKQLHGTVDDFLECVERLSADHLLAINEEAGGSAYACGGACGGIGINFAGVFLCVETRVELLGVQSDSRGPCF